MSHDPCPSLYIPISINSFIFTYSFIFIYVPMSIRHNILKSYTIFFDKIGPKTPKCGLMVKLEGIFFLWEIFLSIIFQFEYN